ncbi:MAG: YcgN family cysteine cluster protein [Robiginitomaculum sp.]|nr:YcgN family cysteine cluster protein [Robiginitomaculum sp.]
MNLTKPFWKTKTLDEMTKPEWESLCDGCGKCCLLRMEDVDTEAVYVTDIRCKLLDGATCRCKNYKARKLYVPDCVQLTAKNVRKLPWIPRTCAYRLLAEGKDLPDWHYLISGSRDTIHEAGMSVKDATVCEKTVTEDDHIQHITIWPGEPDVLPD